MVRVLRQIAKPSIKKAEPKSNVVSLQYILTLVVFTGAVLYFFVYIWIVVNRINYPFELEWIEGGMVDHVHQLLNGALIYQAPGIDFVPFLYSPLYYYIAACAAMIFGEGFFPLRLVSFAASLISLTSIFLIVKAETKNLWVAAVSTGLFIAAFRVTGAWLDIARVDSLYLALLLLFIYFTMGKKTPLFAVITGLISALAMLTKQTAIFTYMPVIIVLARWNWRYALSVLCVTGIIVGGATLIFDYLSYGWYSYFTIDLMGNQVWIYYAFITFWSEDFFNNLPVASIFGLIFFVIIYQTDRTKFYQWLAIFLGALTGSFLTRVKGGGYDNVLLPLYAVMAILFGMGLNDLLRQREIRLSISGSWAANITLLACLMQFAILLYNPFAQIPSAADKAAGYKFVELISNVDGEVYLPDHGYLSTLAGKSTYAHHIAVWDTLRGNHSNDGKDILSKDLSRAIQNQEFDVIIMDTNWNICCPDIKNYYTLSGEVFHDDDVFYPVTGWRIRPTYIYTANRLENQ